MPAGALEAMADEGDMVRVDSLVQEFLSAQSLKVLPQGPFGDAVNRFVSKDDKHAMELFVSDHLSGQVKQLLGLESDEEDLSSAMDIYRARIEQQLASGTASRIAGADRRRVLRPKPDGWDSDFDGKWEDEPDAWAYEGASTEPTTASTRGRSGRGARGDEGLARQEDDDNEDEPPAKATKRTSRTAKAPAGRKQPAKKPRARGRGHHARSDDEAEEEDVVMESDEAPPPPPAAAKTRTTTRTTTRATTRAAGAAARRPAGRAATNTRQTRLAFGSQRGATQEVALEISDDEVSDDEEAFERAPVASRTTRQ